MVLEQNHPIFLRSQYDPTSENLPFRNDFFLITGSTRGIGGALARIIALNGGSVVIHGREKRNKAENLVKGFQKAGLQRNRFPIVIQDLSTVTGIKSMFKGIDQQRPDEKITRLINNIAGGLEPWLETLPEEQRIEYSRNVNIYAHVNTIKIGYEMGMIADGAILLFDTSNYARNWTPGMNMRIFSPELRKFLENYNKYVAGPKNEAEQILLGDEMQTLIKIHDGKLVIVTAGIVTGTPIEIGLKRGGVWDEAISKLGHTDLEHFAATVYETLIDPNIQNRQVVTVPDLSL